jgi:uncharacterized membrane protein
MDRMLVVVFDNERKAYEGKKALLELDSDGTIAVYGYAVISKDANGMTTTRQGDDVGPIGSLLGTSVGSLIGVLGGPAGVAAGATLGFAAGGAFDLHHVRVGSDFLDDVSRALTPNKAAVVALVDEEWITPVDMRMDALGGTIYRRAMSEVTDTVNQEDLAAMKADLAQFKAEAAKERADRKEKIQSKISQLESKIQAQIKAAEERRRGFEREVKAKAQRLQAKASARTQL